MNVPTELALQGSRRIAILAFALAFLGLPKFVWAQAPMAPHNVCVENVPDCGVVEEEPPVSGGATNASAKRWSPGHYMLLYKGDMNASRCDEIGNEANVSGLMIRPIWNEIQFDRLSFDWSLVDAMIDTCGSYGKRVFIFVIDREFGGASSPDRCLAPQYVKDLDGGTGCMASKNGGLPAYHKSIVTDEMISFLSTMAARYDDSPGFGGIQTPESAPGFADVERPEDWSGDSYRNELVRMYQEVAPALRKGILIAGINFVPGNTEELVDAAYQARIGQGGPDLLPSSCTNSTGIPGTGAQKYYVQNYQNQIPAMYQIQAPELSDQKGPCSVEELSAEGQAIGLSHYFWLRRGSGAVGTNWSNHILPAIRAGLPANTTCPSRFTNGCD